MWNAQKRDTDSFLMCQSDADRCSGIFAWSHLLIFSDKIGRKKYILVVVTAKLWRVKVDLDKCASFPCVNMWMMMCSNYYQLPLVKRSFDCWEEQIICWRLPGLTSFRPFHISQMAQSHMEREGKRSQQSREQHSRSFTLTSTPPPVPSVGTRLVSLVQDCFVKPKCLNLKIGGKC